MFRSFIGLLIGGFFAGESVLADEVAVPLGLAAVEDPVSNATSGAKVKLGEALFFEKGLSADGTISCATCHDPKAAFAQKGEKVSKGVGGTLGRRNSPSLFNVAFAKDLFLDGRSESLEDQAWQPILAEDEMANGSVEEVLVRLNGMEKYGPLFEAAFGKVEADKISVAMALAAFQRTLLSGDSAFDKWYWGGESDALSELEQKGYQLFAGRAQCWSCHPLNGDVILMSDREFHNTGIAERSGGKDLGRYEVTKKAADRFAFKTPSLRNIVLTPPYMHDGSMETLEEVVAFYNRGGADDHVQRLELSEGELKAIVAFLGALTGDGVTR